MKHIILVLTCVVSLIFVVACANDRNSEVFETSCTKSIEDSFAPILNAYIAFAQDGFASQDEYFLLHPAFQHREWGRVFLLTFPDRLVYTFHDISGNGISELLIGAEFIEGVTGVFGIYALQNGKPTAIIYAENQQDVSVLINSIGEYIIELSHGRDRFSGRNFYKLDEENNLILVDSFIEGSHWESDPNYDMVSYAYKITNGERISLTQEAYMSLMQMYGSRGSDHLFMWDSFPIPARNVVLAWSTLNQ
ncbi:MAG: hypothetical protein FWC91_14785 [Defluviitaleaceae bacterium]|nr:hypothetical protein [Defluviitaleaceae bacterium]